MPDIDISIRSLAQLYDAMDPAPFHDKALDPRAEAYILSCACEHVPNEPFRLRVFGPLSLHEHAAEIASAVHAHFHLALLAAERHARQRMRTGRATLMLGLAVLGACLLLRGLLPQQPLAAMDAVREGLLILGWVAMWRPVEILLFERWESRQDRQRLKALAHMQVECLPAE